MSSDTESTIKKPLRILTLDGGGAKGFYSLGVLKEVEALIGRPIHEHFNLIYGTSTGAIIAALLGLGKSIDEIHQLYKEHVPTVMRRHCRWSRSKALKRLGDRIFEDAKFDQMKTDVGIVATRWLTERPMIFKTNVAQTHGRKSTFSPGFGCSISEAVQASCSAYPFFNRTTVTTTGSSSIELLDGGYCANNPTLYAIADAVTALGYQHSDIRVLSVGVGIYPEPRRYLLRWFIGKLVTVRLLQKTLNVNTLSMDQLREVLYKDIPTVRVSDVFTSPKLATDLLEHNLKKLDRLFQLGSDSFGKQEAAITELLK